MRSRNDLAEEIALAVVNGERYAGMGWAKMLVADAYEAADALIARRVLAPAVEAGGSDQPAPVAYTPCIGDRVRVVRHRPETMSHLIARMPVGSEWSIIRPSTCDGAWIVDETHAPIGMYPDEMERIDPPAPVATPASGARPTFKVGEKCSMSCPFCQRRWDGLYGTYIYCPKCRVSFPLTGPTIEPAATVDEAVDALVKACGVFRRNHASLSPDAFDAAYPSGVHSIWAAMDALARAKGGGA